ncbi:pilus assembly protein PilM [Paenibacillus sp. JSM ZJ436]|uniref:pilus assembly protein PilM n=1 Tax=Paenibacillus sp. JSM ZJ436 TaxID=3376190 RepID=UPI0037B2DFE1
MLGISQKAAGLSIEQSGIRYVRLKTKTWEMDKTFFLPLPSGVIAENQITDRSALLNQLKGLVKQERLKGSEVSLSVPPSQLIIRKMSIPSTNPRQVEQLVKLEVETGLHLPFETPVYDYIETAKDENQSHILVFAAPRQTMSDFVQVVEEAGLRVSGLEMSGVALARAVTAGFGEEFQETMLVHLEKGQLDVYMYHRGNPVFMRALNLQDLSSDEAWLESAAASASQAPGQPSLSPLQLSEITAEISRMLNFYQYSLHDGSARVQEILITGPDRTRMQLNTELARSLPELQIRELDFSAVQQPVTGSKEHNAFRIAVGTALRRADGGQMDLLPREDREAMLFPFLAISLMGLWVLGLAATVTFFVLNQGEIRDQENRLEALRDQRAAAEQELLALQQSGLSQNGRLEVLEGIAEHRESPVVILTELIRVLPEGAILKSTGYTYRSEMDMTVYLTKMEDASAYLLNLRRLPFTESAMITRLSEGIADSSVVVGGQTYYTAGYRIQLAPGTVNTLTPAEGSDAGGTAE